MFRMPECKLCRVAPAVRFRAQTPITVQLHAPHLDFAPPRSRTAPVINFSTTPHDLCEPRFLVAHVVQTPGSGDTLSSWRCPSAAARFASAASPPLHAAPSRATGPRAAPAFCCLERFPRVVPPRLPPPFQAPRAADDVFALLGHACKFALMLLVLLSTDTLGIFQSVGGNRARFLCALVSVFVLRRRQLVFRSLAGRSTLSQSSAS